MATTFDHIIPGFKMFPKFVHERGPYIYYKQLKHLHIHLKDLVFNLMCEAIKYFGLKTIDAQGFGRFYVLKKVLSKWPMKDIINKYFEKF